MKVSPMAWPGLELSEEGVASVHLVWPQFHTIHVPLRAVGHLFSGWDSQQCQKTHQK